MSAQCLTSEDIRSILKAASAAFQAAREELNALDGAMGDGDHGVTMCLGFEGIVKNLPNLASADVGTLIVQSGLAFNRTAASTTGALLASAAMRAGRMAMGKSQVTLHDIVEMAQAAEEAIRERGRANLGDKTMLDVLHPLTEALAAAERQGLALPEAVERALRAAEEALEATKAMKAKTGRASWFPERTVGVQDPGATSCVIFLRTVANYLKGGSHSSNE